MIAVMRADALEVKRVLHSSKKISDGPGTARAILNSLISFWVSMPWLAPRISMTFMVKKLASQARIPKPDFVHVKRCESARLIPSSERRTRPSESRKCKGAKKSERCEHSEL